MHGDRIVRALVLTAGACWLLAVLLAMSFVSWWLVVVVVLALVLAVPAALRRRRTRHRLRSAAAGGPDAAESGWRELLDASLDRAVTIRPDRSVREMSAELAETHGFDQRARAELTTLTTALEQSWYAPHAAGSAGRPLDDAVYATLAALRPLSMRERLWPRSVLSWAPSPGRPAVAEAG